MIKHIILNSLILCAIFAVITTKQTNGHSSVEPQRTLNTIASSFNPPTIVSSAVYTQPVHPPTAQVASRKQATTKQVVHQPSNCDHSDVFDEKRQVREGVCTNSQ